jgi:hypothetical protein
MSLNPNDTPSFASREQVGELSVLTFHTQSSYLLPDSLVSCSITQFQSVLAFAAKLIGMEATITDEYTRTSLFAEYLKDIEQRQSQEKADIIKRYETQANSDLAAAKAEYEHTYKQSQKASEALEAELESSHRKEIRGLSKKIAELEVEVSTLNKSESLIRERCKEEAARHLKVVEESHREMIRMKDECLSQREQRLFAKEQEIQSKIRRNASSVLRGHDGEHYFKSMAKEKMNWDLVKAPTFSCDYSATINSLPVLFEIKNYTDNVKSDEVKKFLRDMKLHPEAYVGIFISLNTNIQGKDPNVPISMEWVNDSQCVMYFQSCADIDVEYTLSIINQVIRITHSFKNIIESRELNSDEPIFKSRIDQAKVFLDRMITRGSKLMKKVVSDKKQQTDMLEMYTAHNLSELKYQQADLMTTLQTLLGEYSEESEETEVVAGNAEVTVVVEGGATKKPAQKRKSRAKIDTPASIP